MNQVLSISRVFTIFLALTTMSTYAQKKTKVEAELCQGPYKVVLHASDGSCWGNVIHTNIVDPQEAIAFANQIDLDKTHLVYACETEKQRTDIACSATLGSRNGPTIETGNPVQFVSTIAAKSESGSTEAIMIHGTLPIDQRPCTVSTGIKK